jgi:NitT/TauT family transport system substrate-binding protein
MSDMLAWLPGPPGAILIWRTTMLSLDKRGLLGLALGAAMIATALAGPALADSQRIRISEQFGIAYLPLHIIRDQELIEKHGRERGLDITVEWARFSGGAAINEALLSGHVDIATGGVTPLLTIWDRTKGSLDVKGVVALVSLPYYLNTINPDVKTIADFGPDDRIALPSVGVSIQARLLQIAAEQTFGEGEHERLDELTVSLPHPDATAAILAGGTENTAHFTSPFQARQLEDPKVHRVLSSYDILGGPGTAVVTWATSAFREANPDTFAAFLAALDEATAFIAADPAEAARTYIRIEGSQLAPDFVQAIIEDPEITFTTTPSNTEVFATVMHKIGAIQNAPADWRDYFFEDLHGVAGS